MYLYSSKKREYIYSFFAFFILYTTDRTKESLEYRNQRRDGIYAAR